MRKTPDSGLRPLARAGLFLSLVLAATAASTALAVDEPVNNPNVFELDNNAVDPPTPTGDDWESISGTGNSATRSSFIPDPVNQTTDDNFIGGGSKDERDISAAGVTNTYWQNTLTTPPDKNDLEHAFAAAYDINGQLVIYFGADRFSNNGDSAIGFWFFKSDVSDNANGTFTGKHTVGDILVTSDFKQGGSASVINVFEWIGDVPGGPLRQVASSATIGGTVDPVTKLFCLNNGLACAVANPAPVAVPDSWGGFVFKTGSNSSANVTSFPQGTFFEGGVNISALFPEGGTCFASFMAMTRTSASTTAQLKDYVLGSFPLCGISVTKNCQTNSFSPVINADGVSINTRFAIPVTNTGSGPVYDVAIEEDIALGANTTFGTTCTVVSPTPLNGASTALATDTPKALWASIAAGATETAVIECDSLANPLANAVTALAKSSQGAATRDLSADYTAGEGGEGELCPLQVSPSLQVTKECDKTNANAPEGVSLKAGGGFRVCVKVTVTNTSSELLNSVSVIDNKAGTLLTGGSMLPGATRTFGTAATPLCYDTTAADDNETNPGEATFSDTVDVDAIGAISSTPVSGFATATCKLCPTCPDCPVDPGD